MAVDVIFRWMCDYCGATHVQSQGDFTKDATDTRAGVHLHIGSFIHQEMIPLGWNIIHRQLVCPLHNISIRPMNSTGQLAFAKDIYEGQYGGPDRIPDEMIPDTIKGRT